MEFFGRILKLKFTLSDGQSCKAGTNSFFTNIKMGANKESHTFDPRKITKIKVVFEKDESKIFSIDFYHNQTRLFRLGTWSRNWVAENDGRVEVFSIGKNYQLMGCQLHEEFRPATNDHCKFVGITWIKMKVII